MQISESVTQLTSQLRNLFVQLFWQEKIQINIDYAMQNANNNIYSIYSIREALSSKCEELFACFTCN